MSSATIQTFFVNRFHRVTEIMVETRDRGVESRGFAGR